MGFNPAAAMAMAELALLKAQAHHLATLIKAIRASDFDAQAQALQALAADPAAPLDLRTGAAALAQRIGAA